MAQWRGQTYNRSCDAQLRRHKVVSVVISSLNIARYLFNDTSMYTHIHVAYKIVRLYVHIHNNAYTYICSFMDVRSIVIT